ncbi:two-pore potassium channel 3 [Senna tora]|uniref:Two-pore potassium channel 3 n=1 Tax=Senna tora TaxID=362788 RepID=A0A834X9X5_9FABA|nr:two-pore potassium channel 3 [Senna tora]
MENEPLLAYFSPRKMTPPSHLTPLHEEDDIVLHLNPSEIKDRLIFGPSTSTADSAPLVDALTLSLHSPKPSSSSSSSSPAHDLFTSLLDSKSQQTQPNRKLRKPIFHRCKTAPAMVVFSHNNHPPSLPKPQFGSNSIVRQAVILLFAYLSLGVIIYWINRHNFTATETNPIVDALYYCVVTMCTIGYGDITPNSAATKIFSILFVLVGFGFIDILLSGMVSYMLDLQENHLLRTVKSRGEKDTRSYIIDVKKGRMRIRMKVAFALGVVVLCIGVGAGVMHYVERLGWVDSVYLSVMSVTTVGYGDHTFKSMSGRIFAAIWLLVSTLAVARAFLYLAEARVDKRNRSMTKWILGQDMTVSEFLAADLDNNGFVSKSEYVIYKLKELGRVSEKDIMQVSEKFDRLDTGNCGKITLADLMEARPQ